MTRKKLRELLEPLGVRVFDDFLNTKNVPKDYIVIRVGITYSRLYADGKIRFKQPLCRVDVFTNGINEYDLADRVEEALQELNPQRIDLGYLEDIRKTQVTFEFYYK